MLAEIPAEQFTKALDDSAWEVLAEGTIERPPVDAIQLARQLRLVVARDKAMDVRARYVRLGQAGRGTILVGDEPRAERQQWAVAHEIGESVALRVFEGLGVSLEDILPSAREQVANQMASCLLLPRRWFEADGRDVWWDLYELKQRYCTASHELIARRMLEMHPPVIITLFDQGQLIWRRSNVLPRPPALTSAETNTWQVASKGGQPAEFSESDLPEEITNIRCWPIHEPGWRREVMRTELEQW